MADTEEKPQVETPPELVPAPEVKPGDVPKLRSKAFRAKLLSRLPMLVVAKWDAGDALDVYQDFQGIVDLDADAFLQPLEPLAEDRRE